MLEWPVPANISKAAFGACFTRPGETKNILEEDGFGRHGTDILFKNCVMRNRLRSVYKLKVELYTTNCNMEEDSHMPQLGIAATLDNLLECLQQDDTVGGQTAPNYPLFTCKSECN